MERFESLDQCLRMAWSLLYQASVRKNDPMRTPAMSTMTDANMGLRTIVLRRSDQHERCLYYFSDLRAPKVTQIRRSPGLECLFYHPQRNVQIRLSGTAQVYHGNELTRSFWEQLNVRGRSTYATILPPGTPIPDDSTGLPDFWKADMPLEQTEFAYANFGVIRQNVDHIELLHLHDAGHQRAAFNWKEQTWKGNWQIP